MVNDMLALTLVVAFLLGARCKVHRSSHRLSMADTAYRVMFDDPMPEPSKRKNSASNQPDAPVNLHSRPHRKQQRSRVKTLKEEKQHDEEVEENVVPADTEQGNSVSLGKTDTLRFSRWLLL